MKLILYILLGVSTSFAHSTQVYTYVGAEYTNDPRHLYIKSLIKLALNKTKNEFGSFILKKTDQNENPARLFKQIDNNTYENFFFSASITDEILKKYHVIEIPVYRGSISYRIAFTNKKISCSKMTVEKIKESTTIQGVGWLDSKILKANGFQMEEISHYDQMFKMIIHNRVDYFYRGINEITHELNLYPKLIVEPCFALHYPLPKFFITNIKNRNNADRLELGLEGAYKDGSFIKLWQDHFLANIKKLKLNERKLIELNNPFIKTINNDYKKYNFKVKELL